MPIVSAGSDVNLAWALVYILNVLWIDDSSARDTMVAPTPGLSPPGPLQNLVTTDWVNSSSLCKCHYCSFVCCRAGQPHTIHRCRRHKNW